MAIFVPSGAVVAEINGTLDGMVYYRGRYGPVIRRWVNPTNTITPQRTLVRNNFQRVQTSWSTLTQSQRDAWELFATQIRRKNRIGKFNIPSGYNEFISRSIWTQTLTGSVLSDPPIDQPLTPVTDITINNLSPISINFDGFLFDGSNIIPNNCWWLMFTSDNMPATMDSLSNRYRLAALIPSPGPMNHDFLGDFVATWGGFPIHNNKIFFKTCIVNAVTGQETNKHWFNSIVM